MYSVDHVIKEADNAVWRHSVPHRHISDDMALAIFGQLRRLIDEEIIVIEPQERYLDKAFSIALENRRKLLTSDSRQANIANKLGG